MDAVVVASAITRSFASRGGAPATHALRGVDLRVAPGEFVAVCGPSGSGKTTLLHVLAAIDTPSAGEVLLAGRDVRTLSCGARADLRLAHVGLVFSEHNLSPALSVAENVDLPLALRRLGEAERRRRVTAALDRTGVAHLAERFPDTLSSGEQQRVAVARAIAGAPSIVVADEPTAHLDSTNADALAGLLADLASHGMAVLAATHDDRLVARATRVVRLRDGVVVSA